MRAWVQILHPCKKSSTLVFVESSVRVVEDIWAVGLPFQHQGGAHTNTTINKVNHNVCSIIKKLSIQKKSRRVRMP